jgi:hypothetical protein
MLPEMLYPSADLWVANAQSHRPNLNIDHCEHHLPYAVNTFHNYGLLIFLLHSNLSSYFMPILDITRGFSCQLQTIIV